ncbi:hypothetical protein NDU88_007054 [Pleurodeles waltl]|uniref:Uncharacterized protein n=1 Tax=Pleurodeles waltl TaxID=8319 RepID=A0AAV7VRI1_PLEWA|nr:hypothetical protein NDU88_007054 [Pleurodeles waltl]
MAAAPSLHLRLLPACRAFLGAALQEHPPVSSNVSAATHALWGTAGLRILVQRWPESGALRLSLRSGHHLGHAPFRLFGL